MNLLSVQAKPLLLTVQHLNNVRQQVKDLNAVKVDDDERKLEFED